MRAIAPEHAKGCKQEQAAWWHSASGRHLAVAMIFILLTALLTYPLAFHLADAVEDGQDALLNVWIMAWDIHALATDPLHLFDANIFHPYRNTLAYSETNLSQALLAAPVALLSGNPVLGYNLALFLTFVLSGWGMYLLAGYLTGSAWGGLAAGVIYAFNAYRLSNFAQIQLLSLHWLPFALYELTLILEPRRQTQPCKPAQSPRGDLRHTALLCVFLILQALASFYYAIFTALAMGLYLTCYLALNRSALNRAILLHLALAGLVAMLVVLPFAWPYFQVERELGFRRTLAESEPFSASLKQYLEALPNNIFYGRPLAPANPVIIGGYPLDALFPGLLALSLAAYGAWAVRQRGHDLLFYPLLVLASFILSLGPALYLDPRHRIDLPIPLPYAWFYAVIPGFQALRAPVRFAALVFFGLAVLAGMGMARIERLAAKVASISSRRVWAGLGPFALTFLLVLECLTLPAANIYPVPVGDTVPPVYRWLAQQAPTTIIELPLGGHDASVTLRYQYLSTYHWHRTPDGYSGFIPPKHGEMVYEMQGFPAVRSLALLRAYGVQYIIIHTDRLATPLPAMPDDLKPVQAFGADRVYRLLPRTGSPKVQIAAWFPPDVVPGQSYIPYLIIQSLGDTPLVVLPTHKPSAQGFWQCADGASRREEVSLSLPIVTSEAAVVPVNLQAPACPVQSLELRLADPYLGRLAVTANPKQAAKPWSGFPVPARLVQATLGRRYYHPGDTVHLSLRWRALGKIDAYYSAFAAVVDKDGHTVARQDGEPQQGRRPTLLWAPGEEIPDEYALTLPPDLSPGRYTVEVGLYRAGDLAPAMTLNEQGLPVPKIIVDTIKVPLPPVAGKPQKVRQAILGEKIALLGYDLGMDGTGPGDEKRLTVTLYWQALQTMDKDYTVFVHALDADGRLVAQDDSQPRDGGYPTSIWAAGEVVADRHTLTLPPGAYTLVAGMYELATMTRLPVNGDDKVALEAIKVP